MENHGRFGNASQIRSAIFNKLSANFDRIQKSGDFCAILYVGIAEEDVIVETQAFDPLRVKATPTGRKRASVPGRQVRTCIRISISTRHRLTDGGYTSYPKMEMQEGGVL